MRLAAGDAGPAGPHEATTVAIRSGGGGTAMISDDPYQSPHERLVTIYNDDMDEIRRLAAERGTEMVHVSDALEAVTAGDSPASSHEEVMNATGLGFHEARQAAGVLSDMGDLHECYDDGWNLWWVQCDEYIRDRCDRRRISLLRYYQMFDELREFQDQVVAWFVRRNRRQSQRFTMTQLKAEWVARLQSEHFPEKPLKQYCDRVAAAPEGAIVRVDERGLWHEPTSPVEAAWSSHIAARYLRTAQDSIIRSFDLTYSVVGPLLLVACLMATLLQYTPM